jgi:hypothetical protein
MKYPSELFREASPVVKTRPLVLAKLKTAIPAYLIFLMKGAN